MSRYYSMDITLYGVPDDKIDDVKDAVEVNWTIKDWYKVGLTTDNKAGFQGSGCGWLCGGEQEHEAAERFAGNVWEAAGVYCEVEIVFTCLEDLPYATYAFDEDAYDKFLADQGDINNPA